MAGILLSLASGLLFGLTATAADRGMKAGGTPLQALAVTIAVTSLAGGLVLAGQASAGTLIWPPDAAGLGAYAVAGLCGSLVGRFTNMAAVRRIGPARLTQLSPSDTVFTLLASVLLVGDRLPIAAWLGVAAVLSGVTLIATERAARPLAARPRAAAAAAAADHGAGGASPSAGRPGVDPLGVALGLLTGALYAARNVLSDVGFRHLGSALEGTAIGVIASLLAYLAYFGLKGELSAHWPRGAEARRYFLLSGVYAVAAWFTFNEAIALAHAPVATTLKNTTPLWTLAVGYGVYRNEERLGLRTVASALVIFAGVALIALRG
ncbi:MAG: DMT family transporter [Firmicutes bacterium]|nr:DMT family transporter [Bacillota bacterium]